MNQNPIIKEAQILVNEQQEKDLEYSIKIMLLMFRCGYLCTNFGRNPLTKKGKGFFPDRIYRLYNKIMCHISKRHRIAVMEIIEDIHNNEKPYLN